MSPKKSDKAAHAKSKHGKEKSSTPLKETQEIHEERREKEETPQEEEEAWENSKGQKNRKTSKNGINKSSSGKRHLTPGKL